MNLASFGLQGVIGTPQHLPVGTPLINKIPTPNNVVESKPEMPGQGLDRAMNYLADYGGCGYYRCIAPNLLLNLNQKAVILESTAMVADPRFYKDMKAVKFQRQATPHQRDFVKFISQIRSQQPSMKMVYEVDDVVFSEDIPMYNKNREAFTDPVIQSSIKEILSMMDEITVTCEYFKDLMIEKSGNKNVTVVPNYLMKWWFDRYYNLGELVKRFEKNKKKPKISIFASGTHVDVANRVNHKDDFEFVVNHIIKTRKDFVWQFHGSFPIALRPFVASGEIKFFPWVQLPEFAAAVYNSEAQLTFAALQDNNFNRCKSNIKLIESGAIGIPCVCPDMVTYKDAFLKYKTGDEFIDVVKGALKNQTVYADLCKKSRAYADNFWLDDEKNLMKHHEAYFTRFGSKERKFLT
jgi:hypothetical protein